MIDCTLYILNMYKISEKTKKWAAKPHTLQNFFVELQITELAGCINLKDNISPFIIHHNHNTSQNHSYVTGIYTFLVT